MGGSAPMGLVGTPVPGRFSLNFEQIRSSSKNVSVDQFTSELLDTIDHAGMIPVPSWSLSDCREILQDLGSEAVVSRNNLTSPQDYPVINVTDRDITRIIHQFPREDRSGGLPNSSR